MSEESKDGKTKSFKGAKVLWPADMPDDMLEDCIVVSKQSLESHDFETEGVEVAKEVKKHMDEKWEPNWHVFLGKAFGCHAIHEKNRFVYFTFEPSKISFLVYKAS